LVEVKKHSLIQTDKCEEGLVLQERVDELMDQLTHVQEEKKQLQDGKVNQNDAHSFENRNMAVLDSHVI
jgi:predicted  nucleic acid-binding Zn-ribbon protein